MSEPALMGVAALTRRAFGGEDLTGLALRLIQRLEADPTEANTQLDLGTAFMLLGQADLGRFHQHQAIRARQCFHLPASKPGGPRVLALLAPGDLMANTPLPFLLEGSDVDLLLLYVAPGLPLPAAPPPHDLLFNAINETEATLPLLESLRAPLASWPRPVLNPPDAVLATVREQAHVRLEGLPGLAVFPTAKASRAELAGPLPFPFPVILRPLDSHAGHDLDKLDGPPDLAAYLARVPGDSFYLSPFRDYRDADGHFRKYRVAVLGGRSYAVHMGISTHWMIHYLNAGMAESAWKRNEEAAWMASYDAGFGARHAAALQAIAAATRLDYFVLDCAETEASELLVFELDSGAIVHAMDPVGQFPYKQPVLARLFKAFRELLGSRAP